MPPAATHSKGKSGFVKEFLADNPRSNPTIVNEAWTAAGMSGSISAGLVNKIRSEMGLAGNLRGKRGKGLKVTRKAGSKGKRRGWSRVAEVAIVETVPATKAARGLRARALYELESELDRLIFRVMAVGSLTEVEEGLRAARRQLFRAQSV